MAILHKATLTPSKLELLTAHILAQPWFSGSAATDLRIIGAYRFDDPQGEVGVETHLLTTGEGQVIQIPLTYRGAPHRGAEEWLIGTMVHSVLGDRWIYNGCGDPVYVTELIRTILTGDTQVEQYFETADGPVVFEPTATVHGSGTPGTSVPTIDAIETTNDGSDSIIHAGGLEMVVRHLLTASPHLPTPSLSGALQGIDGTVSLAYLR